jgi:hypothetical protein
MLTLVRVSAADTVTVTGVVAADAAKSVVPTYLALTCVWPSGRAVVAIVAEPDASTGAVPSDLDPAVNSTVPDTAPAPGATTDTRAFSVTCCPNTVAAGSADTVVVVADGDTVTDALSVDDLKSSSPP